MLSMRKIVLSAAPIVVAALLAGCGGGGGGGTSNLDGTPSAGDGPSGPSAGGGSGVVGFVSGPVGGQVEAATAEPVAGSVTQSSDTAQGVTANPVTASVSLDDRGLLNADVSGQGWRFRNEKPYARVFDGEWGLAFFERELSDGSVRYVTIATDRNRPAERVLRDGDVWVPSGNQVWNQFYVNLGIGVSGTLNGVQGTLICGDCDVSSAGSIDWDTQLMGRITFNSRAFASDRYDQALRLGIAGSVGDPRRDFRFIRQSDVGSTPDDTDYLVLGFWSRIPEKWLGLDQGDAGFSAAYYKEIERGVFVDGSDPFDQSRIEALTGTATYAGGALVHYVDTNFTGTHPVTGGAIGKDAALEANATLTAQFGSAGENGTISGRIHNFRNTLDETDKQLNPDLYLTTLPTQLTLGSAPIGSSHSGFFKGNTSMTFDGSAFSGKWGGQFYGNGKPHGMPGSTAGTFGAATADGTKSLIGMFGAYKR